MTLKHIIIASALVACLPGYYAHADGPVSNDMSQTGDDISKTATDTGHAIKQTSKDAVLTTKVKTALAQQKDLSSLKIHVTSTASAGVVTLTGTVASADQSAEAESAAKAVDGVSSVNNKLKVKATN